MFTRDRRIVAIVARMPSPHPQIENQPLVNHATLRRYNIQGFARQFLGRARTPPFDFVAPGIIIPAPTFLETTGPGIRAQHEKDGEYVEGLTPIVPTILLPLADNEKAGLHLTDDLWWENTASLILGRSTESGRGSSHGWMIGSDALLFQHPQCPFGKGHGARLDSILQKWTKMVERGVWEVDGNGISRDGSSLDEYLASEGREELKILDSSCV
jgi:hypothetical protein